MGQSLNLRDNGFNVSVGVRKGPYYEKAKSHGWIPNKNLFSIEEVAEKSNIIQFLF